MHFASSLPGLLFLCGVATAIFRARWVPQPEVRLVATDLWVLDQLCRATGTMLRSQAPPKRVAIDLTEIAYVDDSSMASLAYACTCWAEAGVRVTIEGCSRQVADAMGRRGLPVEVRCQPCSVEPARPTTLH